jgi:hypothetical protein
MTVQLTPMQREEIEHLYGIARDEAESAHGYDPDSARRWGRTAEALGALLDGEPLTTKQRNEVVDEIRFHESKWDSLGQEAEGARRSMQNLIDKIDRAQAAS